MFSKTADRFLFSILSLNKNEISSRIMVKDSLQFINQRKKSSGYSLASTVGCDVVSLGCIYCLAVCRAWFLYASVCSQACLPPVAF